MHVRPKDARSRRRFGAALALATGLVAAVLAPTSPASAVTRNQVDVGANVNCNLNGLHQNEGPVSTCRDLTITTQVLVNGADVPQGTVLAVGDVVTVRVVIAPRGGHDAFYQETVDGIRNNDRDQRFAIRVGLPGETGTNLSQPANVVMSRTDNGDRGSGPLINCLAHDGQEAARTDAPTAVPLDGSLVGSTRMNASVVGAQLVAQWDEMAYDRCVNVLSNNGYYAGFTLSFDQVVDVAGTVPLTPTWNLGEVSHELKNGNRRITWGSNADVSLTIASERRPTAVPDTAAVDAHYAGQQATSVALDLLANDEGVGTLTITGVTATTAGGTVDCGVLPAAGPCTYTPPVGHSGADTFHYTVTDDNGSSTTLVTVLVLANAAPAAQDDLFTTTAGHAVSGEVTANDTDPDGDPLVVSTTLVTGPTNGTVVLAADGTFTYEPASGFFGTDAFTYEVCDLHPMLDGSTSSRCSQATVTLNVDPGALPGAVADLAQTDADVAVTIDVLANDDAGAAGPVAITFAGVGAVAGTTVAGGAVICTATCTYTPPAGYSGSDAFTYTITDGGGRTSSATVLVLVVGNRAPLALPDAFDGAEPGVALEGDLSANDVDLDGDALVYDAAPVDGPHQGTVTIASDGTFTYLADPGATGTDGFTYRVCDDHTLLDGTPAPACTTATVTITIAAMPTDPPVVVEDSAITDRDIAVEVDVLANDQGASIAIAFAGFAGRAGGTQAGGAVTCEAVCTYTPPLGFSGTDVFAYTVIDEHGVERTTYAWITVVGNRAPLAADDLVLTPIDAAVSGDLAGNDLDLDGHGLTYTTTAVVGPSNGTVTIASDGTFTYVPNPGFTGVDQFVYEVCDDHQLLDGTPSPACAQALATVLVGMATVDDLPGIHIHIDADLHIDQGRPGGQDGSDSGQGGSGGGSGPGGPLARTGAELAGLAAGGLLASVLGLALVTLRRRSAPT
jgi:hypothetical protein